MGSKKPTEQSLEPAMTSTSILFLFLDFKTHFVLLYFWIKYTYISIVFYFIIIGEISNAMLITNIAVIKSALVDLGN